MRFVICDDDEAERKRIASMVEEYVRVRGVQAEVLTFADTADLLRTAADADVYLLDILMPDQNGIELARALRAGNRGAAILYLTSSADYALDAFSVRAASYLVKPVEEQQLFAELDECVRSRLKRFCTVDVRRGGSVVTEVVALDELIAVEYHDHRLTYRLTGDRLLTSNYKRGSFETMAANFHAMPEFLKLSASYLVNMRHVRQLEGDDFIMSDGTHYRVTRRYQKAKKQYIDFILE